MGEHESGEVQDQQPKELPLYYFEFLAILAAAPLCSNPMMIHSGNVQAMIVWIPWTKRAAQSIPNGARMIGGWF